MKRGVVEGRGVWGSTCALFHCADVALGYCFVLLCSSTFFFSPPSPPAFQHTSPSFSLYFHLSAIIFPSIISARLLPQRCLPLSPRETRLRVQYLIFTEVQKCETAFLWLGQRHLKDCDWLLWRLKMWFQFRKKEIKSYCELSLHKA